MEQAVNSFRLDNRYILITGASGHLGQEMSKCLAGAGGIVLLAGRNIQRLEELAAVIQNEGGKAFPLQADISEPASRKSLIEEVNTLTSGSLHGLVNNAYSGRTGSPDMITSGDFLQACNVTLSATLELIQHSVPLLEKSAGETGTTSSIVNIGSMYGLISPDPEIYSSPDAQNPIHYGAVKAGLIQMSRYLAVQYAGQNIRVNSLSPGAFPPADEGTDRSFLERLEKKIPMRRIGTPAEVANPLLFLLSDAATYITGANLVVDGGWTAW